VSDAADAGAALPADDGEGSAASVTPDERRRAIGWPRAIASGLGLVLIGVAIGVYGAETAVEKLTGIDRDQRVWVATGIMTVSVVLMAWVLRRLQARGVI
jgi:hypothetical protein